MGKAKHREKKSAGEKFRDKIWYTIEAPKVFGNKEIGKTPAFEGNKKLKDRVFEATLYDLTADFNHTHIILRFKFQELLEASNTIKTMFIGSDFTRDYLRSLVRRTTSRIDGIFNLTTKDGYFIRVTAIVLTQRRAKSNQQKEIRNIMRNIIERAATTLTFSEFSYNAVYGNIAKEITQRCEKIYPVRRSEVMKIKLVKMPKDSYVAS
ncbi:MAG: 30S ribosomal protein S3ae [Candidatus Helarchaeota archaeon]|nr:30S ribosomal protein S3ae [Candidatus Helarchaeota archaeon]